MQTLFVLPRDSREDPRFIWSTSVQGPCASCALLYQSRTGCQWDYLPLDLPPVGAVKYYFHKWRDDGTDQTIHDLLRWQVRESRGRKADPSLVVLDTQSLHAAAGVPAGTTGRDAAKKSQAASAAWQLMFSVW